MLKTFFVGRKNSSSFCGEAIEEEKRGFKTKIETFGMKDIHLNFFHLGFHCVAFFEKEFDPKLFSSLPMCVPASVLFKNARRDIPFKSLYVAESNFLFVIVLSHCLRLERGKLLGESFFLFNQSRVILSART